MANSKRSDEVRARRAQRTTGKKPARKAKRNSSPAAAPTRRNTTPRRGVSSGNREMPAMVTRRGVMARPAQPGRSSKQTRRIYDIALPAARGASVRLPAVPRVPIGWRFLSFLMVIGLFWALYAVWTSPQFMVSTVEVDGLLRVPQHEIEANLNVIGMSIFSINPELALADLIKEFPDLSNAAIEIGFPALVKVVVTERVPVISWEYEDVTFLVDMQGYSFVPRGELDLVHVIASAPPPAPAIPLNIMEEAMDEFDGRELEELYEGEYARLEAYIEDNYGPFPYMTTDLVNAILELYPHAPEEMPLVYHPKRGLGWFDEAHDWKVYFGSQLDRLTERLNVYTAIVARFEEDRIPAKLISIEFLHAPYYRFTED